MDFSCVTRHIFPILPLLVILSMTPLSSSFSLNDRVTNALINQLCSEPSIYKHFCVFWLTSDPKTFTLDMQGLVNMVYEKTESFGYKNLEMIKGLETTTTDPKLKSIYGSCVEEYELSTQAIKEAKGYARSKAYKMASEAAFDAFNSIAMCEAFLEGLQIPAYVTTRTVWFERMCYIGLTFSYLFV